MFEWYRRAFCCLAYLQDVQVTNQEQPLDSLIIEAELRDSAWFRRGWTLQELLAPRNVVFLSKEFIAIGYKGRRLYMGLAPCYLLFDMTVTVSQVT